jgi:hypothetical protein
LLPEIPMKISYISILIILLTAAPLFSQGEIDDQKRVMLRDESTYGAFLSSNGYGATYRYGFWRDARNQFILDADFAYVKHPKEVNTTIAYNYSTHRYVYGKENLFWELKGMAGWQKELYRKIDRTGISVRLYYAGGISIGFLKPVYYKVFTTSPFGEITNEEFLKFNPAIHQQSIGGRGPFFMGFNEIKIVPGLTAKAGFSFEYSQKDAVIHALDAGISLTVYPKEIEIMAVDNNNFLFFNLIVAYRFGRIIDISEAARSKSRKEKKAERKAQEETIPYPGY